MKKLLVLVFVVSVLAACTGSADADLAQKYGLSTEQYSEIKAAAEGMGMNVEAHIQSLGFQPKN